MKIIRSKTPFRDAARRIAEEKNYNYGAMAYESDEARSHAWWRNVVDHGAWSGPTGGGRVGPPGPETFPGIAKLFDVTEDDVRRMIAADWYGVHPDAKVSERTLRLGRDLDHLNEDSAELVRTITKRLRAADRQREAYEVMLQNASKQDPA